jgi:hypothetical protein
LGSVGFDPWAFLVAMCAYTHSDTVGTISSLRMRKKILVSERKIEGKGEGG